MLKSLPISKTSESPAVIPIGVVVAGGASFDTPGDSEASVWCESCEPAEVTRPCGIIVCLVVSL